MTIQPRSRALPLLVAVFSSGTALAETAFTPADFSTGDKSLGNLIEFPELRGDASVTISCLGLLSGRGKFDQHACYQRNPGDETFIAPIYKAVKKARLKPASYAGRQVDVVFQYRVKFVKAGDEQTLNFVANPGYEENVDAYGPEHIAAQRLMHKETWQNSCPQQTKFLVLARANVDYDGRPSAVSIDHADGIAITPRCEAALVQNLLDSRFIPAFADGEAVPSTFVEPFGN